MNSSEPVGCIGTRCRINISFEYSANCASRSMVHSIAKFEVADRKLGLSQIGIETVECWFIDRVMLSEFGVESLERFEVGTLIGVEESLPVVGISAYRISCDGRRDGADDDYRRERERDVVARCSMISFLQCRGEDIGRTSTSPVAFPAARRSLGR